MFYILQRLKYVFDRDEQRFPWIWPLKALFYATSEFKVKENLSLHQTVEKMWNLRQIDRKINNASVGLASFRRRKNMLGDDWKRVVYLTELQESVNKYSFHNSGEGKLLQHN